MIDLLFIQDHVTAKLTTGLAPGMTYHNVDHTMDVFEQCMSIANQEGITDKQPLLNLSLAALYHDTGFIYIYQGHEEKSCEIARAELPGFGLDPAHLDDICELIMATKVPQTPVNHLQNIICDADLDYLGRADFYELGAKLHRELTAFSLVGGQQEWEELQLKFLREHHFFTATSTKNRTAAKFEYIQALDKKRNTKAL